MTKNHDAIVVGGGHNGLVAAFYLARGGLSVLVLERRHVVGGPCGAYEFFPGYRGAISNSPGSLEPKIVRDMELERHGLTFDRPDPTVVLPFPDGRAFIGWRDRERVDAQIQALSPRDVEAYHGVFEHFTNLARKLRVNLFEAPPGLSELLARLETPEDEADFAEILFGNVRDFLDDRLESPVLKGLIAAMSMFNGNYAPSTPGSALALLQRPMSLLSTSVDADHDPRKQPLRGSTGLPRGGMGAVAAAMRQSLEALGVIVRTEAGVAAIRIDADHRVKGVALANGEEIDSGIVLSNLNPKTTLLDLVEPQHLEDNLRTRLQRLRMRGCASKLVIAVGDVPRLACAPDDLVREYATCQFRIAPDVEHLERSWDDARNGRTSREPRVMGLIPTMTDPTIAPPGKQLLSLNCWHAPYHLAEGDWSTERDIFRDRIIDTMVHYMPNLKDIIEDVRFFAPTDLEAEFGLLEGHQLHGDMTPGRMFGLRPMAGLSRYRTPVRGLYLCGAGTWPGGFVSGLPGHNGSQQALRDLAIGLDRKAVSEAVERDVDNRL